MQWVKMVGQLTEGLDHRVDPNLVDLGSIPSSSKLVFTAFLLFDVSINRDSVENMQGSSFVESLGNGHLWQET